MKLEVGARVKKIPAIFDELHKDSETFNAVKDLEGTVVYVNFAHRYFTVEYEFKNGMKFRESFKIVPPKSRKKKVCKYD